ncbi:hypothetical protein Tco_0357041 [Tanacetum coccineum]
MGCLPRSACLMSLSLARPRIHWSLGKVWRSGITICGMSPPKIKEEDSINNVENAVLDLGVMDPLCLLFVDQDFLHRLDLDVHLISFFETFMVIARGNEVHPMGVLNAVRKAHKASSNLS